MRTYTNANEKGEVWVGGELVTYNQPPGQRFYTERHRVIDARTGKVRRFEGHPDISDGDVRGGGGQAALAHDPFTKLLFKLLTWAALIGLVGGCLLSLIPADLTHDSIKVPDDAPPISEGKGNPTAFWVLVALAVLSVYSVYEGAKHVIPHSARVPRK